MKCARCGISLNPKHARHDAATGLYFGPVCSVRLGLVTVAQKRLRKRSNAAIFGPCVAVKVDDGQAELFGEIE